MAWLESREESEPGARFVMSKRFIGLSVATLALGVVTGCCDECCRPGPPIPCPPPCGRGPTVPAGPVAPPPCWPGAAPAQPAPAVIPAQPAPAVPPAALAPPVTSSNSPPSYDARTWQPSPRAEVRLSPPVPLTPEQRDAAAPPSSSPSVPPQTPPNAAATPQTPPETAATAPQPPPDTTQGDRPATTPTLPVGIPQFANAKGRVAAGLTPLPEGFDWLKANGYKMVLFLRQPGADETRDRQLAEQRGLAFRTLDVAPQTLSKTTVEEFNRLVDDPANQPLFVYDRNGIQSGAMWYLHFLTAEQASDQIARDQAERLGLVKDPTGDHLTMWLAVQKLLSQ